MTPRLMQHAEPLPGYKLIERLGRGGYGEVWKAEAPGGLFKAIKFVYGDLDNAGEDNKGAEQELKALNRVKTIRHPYILSIERFDIVEGQLMIVMELADRNLWDRFHECRSKGMVGIPRDELFRYLDESSEALDLMNIHYQIQHLDIKPQNLFLVHNHVKVADFGLAKDFEGIRATVTGGVTPVYAAPETFEGWVSRFSDQYSLAIVYQELLTGVRPFSGTNTRHLLMQHISAPPDVSPLQPNEREIVARALAKKPDERFPSCTDFVKALRNAGTAPVSASVPTIVPVQAEDVNRTLPNFKPQKPNDTTTGQHQVTPPTIPTPPTLRPPGMLRGLPKLVTPGTSAQAPVGQARPSLPLPPIAPAPITLLRPAATETGRISRLGIAPPEKVGEGVLVPVYVVGTGRLGLQVIQRLRSYLHERFGRGTFPHWKWLFIDTDPAAIEAATSGPRETMLESSEVFHARMQRPAHYLKRVGLPPPETWMTNEMLYRIPREPATEGIRSLGRLAFLDHYPVLSTKIRQDIETFLSDDVLLEADRQTKLGIRTNRPRVYLATSLAGGTGSGMMVDLAYLIRGELRQMGFLKSNITGLLLAPPVDRSTPKTLAIANACTALAELHHFSQPSTRYEAKLDTRQPSVADPEKPFDRCVLLSLPRNPNPKVVPPSADRAAGLVYQEALTPLGRRNDEVRAEYQAKKPPIGVSLQSFGCYRITWPRQRMLDTVAERFAARMVHQWCGKDASAMTGEIGKWFEDHWSKGRLDVSSIKASLEMALATALNGKPEALIEAELQVLTQDKADLPDVVPIVDRIMHLVGKHGREEDLQPGRWIVQLEAIAKPITKESEIKFARMAVHFVEQPQFRLAGAEDAIHLCTERLQSLIADLDRESQKLGQELEAEFYNLAPLLAALPQGKVFRGASRRATAVSDLVAWLKSWPQKRVQYLLSRGAMSVYRQMLGNAPEYLREVNLCRIRLTDVAASLQKQAESSSRLGPGQDHPILPPGCKKLLEAADRFLSKLPADSVREFEDHFQQTIRRQLRGLVNICLTINENGPRFKEMLVGHARAYLDTRLGQHTPAEEFFRNRPDPQTVQRDILLAYDESTPEPFGPTPKPESQTLLIGVTADEFGKRLVSTAQELIPEFEIISVPSVNEIVFFREYHDLSVTEVPQAGTHAVDAVRAVKQNDRINTLSRNDVHWTTPWNE